MAVFKEFREFAFKGNVVDLAVAVMIGAAFGKIVEGVVRDVVMPLVGLAIPGGNWRTASITLRAGKDPVRYGDLLGLVIDFFIIAFVLFLVISAINRMKKKPAPTPETRECPACLETIPKAARRCKHCTEVITPVPAA